MKPKTAEESAEMNRTVMNILASSESRDFIKACFQYPSFALEHVLQDPETVEGARRRRAQTEGLKLRRIHRSRQLRRLGVLTGTKAETELLRAKQNAFKAKFRKMRVDAILQKS